MSESFRLDDWRSGVAQACRAERVRLLFALSPPAMAAACAAALLVAFWMWPTAGRPALLAWLAAALAVLGAQLWLQRRYRARPPRAETAPRWERRFALLSAAGGILWGLAILLLLPQAGEPGRLFVFLALSSVCLGATALLTPSRAAYYAFMAPLSLAAAWFMLGHLSSIGAAAAGAILVYLAVLAGAHEALHRSLLASLDGRFASEALAAEHNVIFDSAAEAIGLIRPNYIAKCNRQWCALFGYAPEAIVGQPAWTVWPSYEDWRQFAKECRLPISQGKPYSAIVQLRRAGGELFWAEISGMAVDPDHLDLGVVWMGTDISQRLRTETALKASEQRFRDLVSLSTDWYWEVDSDFRFTRISGRAMDNSGYTNDSILGRHRWELPFIRGVSAAQWQAHRETLAAHVPFRDFTYQIVTPNGESRWFCISGNPAFNEHGDFDGYHGVGTDITERVLAAEQYRHLAHHDTLTGLPNRRLLSDRAEQALALARRSGHPAALLLLDLDDFKIINDTKGHSAGDAVLVAIAQRLRAVVREVDTVARLGGDEFVILLQEIAHPHDAIRVAEKTIEAIREPVTVGGRQYVLGVSVGIAHFPQHAGNIEGLMQKADIAMYLAKQGGGSAYRFADSVAPPATAAPAVPASAKPAEGKTTH